MNWKLISPRQKHDNLPAEAAEKSPPTADKWRQACNLRIAAVVRGSQPPATRIHARVMLASTPQLDIIWLQPPATRGHVPIMPLNTPELVFK